MTLTDIYGLTRSLLTYNLDHWGGDASDASEVTNAILLKQINRMQMRLSRKIWLYFPKLTLTLTADESTYDIENEAVTSRRLFKPMLVWINGNVLYNDYGPGMRTMAELPQTWVTDTADTPTMAVHVGSRKMIVHPKPTAAVVTAAQNFIAGFGYASDIAGSLPDSETPGEIPNDLHEALCWMTAYNSALPTAAEADMWQRLGSFDKEAADRIADYARMNKAAAEGGHRPADSFRRVMSF